MIEKIVKIQNVGKFVNCTPSGDVALRKITLIYSENGQGKTTLSAILRSLCTGESRYIEERRTLGQNGAPAVNIRLRDSNAKFADGKWDNTLSTVEIFDPTFVNKNVYAGDAVDHSHKKNLHSFAIGEDGVRLAKRVAELDDAIDHRINPKINSTKLEIEKHIMGEVDVDAFVALERVDNVDQIIADKEKEVEALYKADMIANKPPLSPLTLPEVPIEKIENLMLKGLEDVSADAERTVKEHLSQQMDDAGESWVGQGMQYIKDEQCPFCGQDIQSLRLIKAYRDYFSEAYLNFKKEISETLNCVNGILSQDGVLQLQGGIDSNELFSSFWKRYIEVDLPDIVFDEIKASWNDTRQVLSDHLNKKAAALLEKIVPSQEWREALTKYASARVAIEKYNRSIEEVNDKIAAKKNEVKTGDPAEAQQELQRLQNAKNRFDEEINRLCTAYLGLKTEKVSVEQEKSQARKELEEYSSNVIDQYHERINDYLEKFGTNFRITEVREKHLGGKPSLHYRLLINDNAVDLDAPDLPEPTPCFKNTLSSGDKSTLAFAFFLARLDLDSCIEGKVVVLDDPISSLDCFRRTCTQQQIARVGMRAEQVILMSHDPYFLRLIWESSDRSLVKTLCLKRTQAGSTISDWDIQRATEGAYVQDYHLLSDYLEKGADGDMRAIAHRIRPLLEVNLRFRFPRLFEGNDWLGNMLTKIGESSKNDSLCRLEPFIEELTQINDYSKKFHHSQNPDADNHPVTDAELKTYVKRALDFVSGAI